MTTLIQTHPIARIVNALFSAVAVTFGLLLLMQFLISNDLEEPQKIVRPVFSSVYYEDKKIIDMPDDKEELVEPVVEPLLPNHIEIVDCVDCLDIHDGSFDANPGVELSGVDIGGGSPLRLVTAAPVYPIRATEKGVEGFVDIQFDIGKDGSTSNLKIINYQPSTIFNRAVLRAVAKWRYRPKMVEGIPVAVLNIVERVSFKLEK